MVDRQWVKPYIPAAFMIGACFVVPGGGVVLGIATGIAANVASVPTEQAIGWVRRRLSKDDQDRINHDLQNAMVRGNVRAVDHLRDIWINSYQRDAELGGEGDAEEAFQWMKDDAARLLTEDRLRSFLDSAEAVQNFGSVGQLDGFLAPYLHGRTTEIGRFLKSTIVPETAMFFSEELKSDTKAWRAFQRLVTDSMIAGFARVETTQVNQHSEVLEQLESLAKKLETEPVENVISVGIAGLESAILACQKSVDESTKRILDAVRVERLKLTGDFEAGFDLLSAQADAHLRTEIDLLNDLPNRVVREFLEQQAKILSRSQVVRSPEALMPLAGRSGNQHFTGRADKLEELESAFFPAIPDEPMLVVLHGTGGVGKSQIALEYAVRTERRYAGIWWILAESQTTVTTRLDGLSAYLDLPASKSGDQQLSAAAALRFLEEQNGEDRWLLVFDNAADVNLVSQHIPHRGSIDVIVTSQLSNWDGDRVFRPIPIAEMSPEDARVFLTQRSGDGDENAANKLAKELGYLPLALELAGAYVAVRRSQRSLSRYLQRFHDNPSEVIRKDKAKTGSYPNTLATTWAIALVAASEEVPESSDVMTVLSFMAPEAIPLDLIREHAHVFAEPLRSVFADPDHAAFEVLERYSLITIDEARDASVHRLIQAVTLDQIDDERRTDWIDLTVRLLLEMLPGDAGEFSNWAIASRVIPHAMRVLQHGRASNLQKPACAVLMSHAASFTESQGNIAEARDLYEEALALNRRELPAEHPEIATNLNNLAGVMEAQGELTKARELYEEALALSQRVLPAEHPAIATNLNNLAGVMEAQGELTKARDLYEEALALNQRVLPDEHPEIATILSNLAHVLNSQGELTKARELYEEVLALRQRVLSSEHPDIARSLNNLASVLLAQGDLTGARTLFEESLTQFQRALPTEHPDLAVSLNSMASVLQAQGKLPEARTLFEEALALRQRVLSSEHPDIATSLNNLAGVLDAQGELPAARELYEEALALNRRVLPAEHADIATSLNNLAFVVHAQGDLMGARALYEEALMLTKRILPVEHPDIGMSLNNLAGLLDDQGDLTGARALFEESLALMQRVLPSEHPDIATSLNNLAYLLQAQGELTKARELYEEALAILEVSLPLNHPTTAIVRENLNGLIMEIEDRTDADST